MKTQIITLSAFAICGSHAFAVTSIASFGGDYVSATQASQASLTDVGSVPSASDSIREVGGFNILANPTISSDYTGPAFRGGAQVVKFGVNNSNGAATAQVIQNAGGDYVDLFAQSPSGTTDSHLNFIFSMDVNTIYNNLVSFSGRTAGGVSGSVISRFMVETSAGDLYLSNTSISGGNGEALWSISDLSTENWALFTPGANDWRGDFGSLTFNTVLDGETLTSVGWMASRDTNTAGFINSRLTIREFDVEAIPEPSTSALFAGLLGLGCVLTRRRNA